MSQRNQIEKKNLKLLTTTLSVLAIIPLAAEIYPVNALPQKANSKTVAPSVKDAQTTMSTEVDLTEKAVKIVNLKEGKINIKLQNKTNALVFYEAIEHTGPRFLLGQEEVLLQELPANVTVTLVRADKGLLKASIVPTSEPDTLEVSLDETVDFARNQSFIRVQRDGKVFLN